MLKELLRFRESLCHLAFFLRIDTKFLDGHPCYDGMSRKKEMYFMCVKTCVVN